MKSLWSTCVGSTPAVSQRVMVLTPFYQEKLTLRFDQSRSAVRYTVYSIKYKAEQAEVQGMAVKDSSRTMVSLEEQPLRYLFQSR